MTKEKPLNKRQQVFVSEYLKLFNGTEAYMRAYKPKSREGAAVNASNLLRDTKIQDQVQARLAEIHMSADEALKLQADIARGDITEFMTPLGALDIDKLRDSGHGRLVKKIKQKTITKIGKNESDDDTEIHETELELYPADVAQERILKIAGKFTERVEVKTPEEGIKVVIEYVNKGAVASPSSDAGEGQE
jgi:hypothetical protein